MYPFGLVVLVVVSTIVLRRMLAPAARVRRALRGVPATAVSNVRDGCVVKLVGTVELLAELPVAPLSRRSCLHYLLVVDEKRKTGTSEIWRESQHVDFLLRDATGTALVRLRGALVAGDCVYRWRKLPFVEAPPPVAYYIGEGNADFWDPPRRTVTELALGPHGPVAVGGLARWELDPDERSPATYREATRRLVLESTPELPLLVSRAKGRRPA